MSDDRVTVHHGDALDVLRELADNSIDAVVTDPPYGLEFMGKDWDSFGDKPRGRNQQQRQAQQESGEWWADNYRSYLGGGTAKPRPGDMVRFQQWCEQWATECLRVLKPGGHMLAFGGTRTWHRLACAIEDAGFEVRDSIAWLYGSGFPKSLDVSKAIDKGAGATREVVGEKAVTRILDPETLRRDNYTVGAEARGGMIPVTAPATPAAQQWAGWGTALKPAFEPVVVARKPLAGTVASTVLQHGTGGLNVDACRVGMSQEDADFIRKTARPNSAGQRHDGDVMNRPATPTVNVHAAGRWPTNVVLDGTDWPLVRLRASTPPAAERLIREFFGARTDHLPPVREADDRPAEPEGPEAVLLPRVLRGVDGRAHDRREGAPVREGAHARDTCADECSQEGARFARPEGADLEGRSAPVARVRRGEPGDADAGGAGTVHADGDGQSEQSRRAGAVCGGTPTGHGAADGPTAPAVGAGASRQRDQDGQPAGEPGTARRGVAPEGARQGRGGDSAAPRGELHAAAPPLEVVGCLVPEGWRDYFEVTGRRSVSAAAELDQQSGTLKSGGVAITRRGRNDGPAYGAESRKPGHVNAHHPDEGGASRFFPVFRYQAKAPTRERPKVADIAHPTVKPLDLMRWLVRLVTPPDGIVLDPFAGSGTTVEACLLEGFRCIAIEREADYLPLINARIARQLTSRAPVTAAAEALALFDFEEPA